MPRPLSGSQETSAGSQQARPPALDDLPTEAGGDADADYDRRPTRELVELMQDADTAVLPAVEAVAADISAAVDAIVERLRGPGRLVYVGAGSSGRIAALDASECESTFSTPHDLVLALVAGGAGASPLEQEAAEDDREAGAEEVGSLGVSDADAVVGVSASGRTPYVLGAIATANEVGALTVGIVSVAGSELGAIVDHEIAVLVGPEFIAGSTRLKAGTAQKLVLNTISTVSMIRLGKTFGNLMVDVFATNDKLHARVRRIVRTATGATPEQVDETLAAAGGEAKVAIVSLLAGVGVEEARAKLAASGQHVRSALEGRTA